ncbi:sel1 repeat family protein, partial [Streptomyces sp. SID8382]|nr:sel1 repeat family protein [Streptomyces sp. SID8382]
GDLQGAERHLRCAAGGGSAEGAFRLAALLDRSSVGGDPATGTGFGSSSGTRFPTPPPHDGSGPIVPEYEEWYERAARQGHRRSQVRVGMFAAARGDVVEAARWYRTAAEAGSSNGAFNLGLLLAREGSEPEAALWWTRAAEAGHGRAALRLA